MLTHCQRLQRGRFDHMGTAALREHIEQLTRLRDTAETTEEYARYMGRVDLAKAALEKRTQTT